MTNNYIPRHITHTASLQCPASTQTVDAVKITISCWTQKLCLFHIKIKSIPRLWGPCYPQLQIVRSMLSSAADCEVYVVLCYRLWDPGCPQLQTVRSMFVPTADCEVHVFLSCRLWGPCCSLQTVFFMYNFYTYIFISHILCKHIGFYRRLRYIKLTYLLFMTLKWWVHKKKHFVHFKKHLQKTKSSFPTLHHKSHACEIVSCADWHRWLRQPSHELTDETQGDTGRWNSTNGIN